MTRTGLLMEGLGYLIVLPVGCFIRIDYKRSVKITLSEATFPWGGLGGWHSSDRILLLTVRISNQKKEASVMGFIQQVVVGLMAGWLASNVMKAGG